MNYWQCLLTVVVGLIALVSWTLVVSGAGDWLDSEWDWVEYVGYLVVLAFALSSTAALLYVLA